MCNQGLLKKFLGIATACFETVYDGVDDSFNSSDAALKITGNQTWFIDFTAGVGTSGGNGVISSYSVGSVDYGFRINLTGTNINFRGNFGGSDLVIASAAESIGTRTYCAFVMNAGAIEVFVNGVSKGTSTAGALTAPLADLYLGRQAFSAGNFLDGTIHRMMAFSGTVTNGGSWTGGDSSTVTGGSLVVDCSKGSGENNQGISFTTGGDPTTQECA